MSLLYNFVSPFDEDVMTLYDYRNRAYSPDLSRFLQTDPIRFNAGDVNLYRYVGNNSVNWTDPEGLAPMVLTDPHTGFDYCPLGPDGGPIDDGKGQGIKWRTVGIGFFELTGGVGFMMMAVGAPNPVTTPALGFVGATYANYGIANIITGLQGREAVAPIRHQTTAESATRSIMQQNK